MTVGVALNTSISGGEGQPGPLGLLYSVAVRAALRPEGAPELRTNHDE
jgi:hypothetical protein